MRGRGKTRNLAAGVYLDPFTIAATASGWNQFYLYQCPYSVSGNLPHVAGQPGEKRMCFPIMKWNTTKNKFKKVSGWSRTVHHSFNLQSGVKHNYSLAYETQQKWNILSDVCLCLFEELVWVQVI